ncbi:MAG: tetratricopeptide repeat protein [Armatimonadetes bacterium]|nr:tetratricopeptide repeat protein [Armatimonadota bacterium]
MSLFRKNDKDGKSPLTGSKGTVENKPVLASEGGGQMQRKAPRAGAGAPVPEGATKGGPRPPKKFEKSHLGEITGPLDEALDEVLAALEEAPEDDDLHMRRYEVLRRIGDRRELQSALEESTQVTGRSFYAVKLAGLLEEDGEYSSALSWRTRIVEMTGDDPDAFKKLAVAHVRTGDLKGAEPAYMRLLELKRDVDSPLGTSFLDDMTGRGLPPETRSGLQAMGMRIIDAALATRAGSIPLLELGARLAARAGDYGTSIPYFQRLIDGNPEHANIRSWKGELLRVLARAGIPEHWKALNAELISDYVEHLTGNRSDVRSWITLARLQMQAGFSDDALASFKSAVRADSREWQAVYEHGRLLVRLGRSDEAIRWYEDILDPYGGDAPEKKSVRRALERSLAELYFKMGRYQDSLNIYSREEEANIRFIAPIYEAAGYLDRADELYKKAAAQSPKDAKVHQALAEYQVRRGSWDEVERCAREGLACSNAYDEVLEGLYVALATAQMNRKNVEAALGTMEQAVKESPDSASMLFRKVKLTVMAKKPKEGRALAERVRDMLVARLGCAPAHSGYWSLLGDCYSLLGNIPDAENAYTTAIRYDAQDAPAVRGLGVLAERNQDLPRALDLYKRFVTLDPLNLATLPIKQKIQEIEQTLAPPAAATAEAE